MAQAVAEVTATGIDEDQVSLRGFCTDSQRRTLPALLGAMERSGSWLREQRQTSLGECEMMFEARLGAIMEVYSAIIGSGVELTHESHRKMTSLCTLRRHQPRSPRRRTTVSLRLDLRLLDEFEMDLTADPLGLA